MKQLFYLWLFLLSCLTACTDAADQISRPAPDDGAVKIRVTTPKIATRATENMPENSTFRLFVYQSQAWDENGKYVAQKTYRINENGVAILCAVNEENGEWIRDSVGTALHLPADTYHFLSVSPAVKFGESSAKPGLQIFHGDKSNFRTSVNRNVKVSSTSLTGEYNLKLHPFELLMSKISFKLIKDNSRVADFWLIDTEKVSTPSGVGNNLERSVIIDKLSTENYMGNNYTIGNKRITPLDVITDNGKVGRSLSNGEITLNSDYDPSVANTVEHKYIFESEVLPCRLISDVDGSVIDDNFNNDPQPEAGVSHFEETMTELTLHIKVLELKNAGDESKAIYKKYSVKLPAQSYERGKKYNYTLKVNIGGILVDSWQTSEWETVIE